MLSVWPGRWPSWFAGGVFIVATAVESGPPVVRPAQRQGLIYTATVVGNRQRLARAPGADTTVSVEQFAGDDERLDIRHLSASATARGGDSLAREYGQAVGLYTLRKRGSWRLTVVDTARRQYFEYDQDSAMRVVFSGGPEAQVQTGDTAFTTRVNPDTIIDGRPTEHWRLTTSATMRMKFADLALNTTTDLYIATEMTDMRFRPPGGGQLALFAGEAYARKRLDVMATLPHGLEVLSITQTVAGGGIGASRATTETRRLSDIRYVEIPAEVFAIPAGYERVAPPIIPHSGTSPAGSN
jgi:hypothetical protein